MIIDHWMKQLGMMISCFDVMYTDALMSIFLSIQQGIVESSI